MYKRQLPKDSKLLKFLGRAAGVATALQVFPMIEDLNSLMNGAPEEEKKALAEAAADLQKVEAVQDQAVQDLTAIAKAKAAAAQRILNDANATGNKGSVIKPEPHVAIPTIGNRSTGLNMDQLIGFDIDNLPQGGDSYSPGVLPDLTSNDEGPGTIYGSNSVR